MRRILWGASLAVAVVLAISFAAQAATEQDAKAFAQKVVQYTKDNGKDKAIAEILNPKGQFKRADLLINFSDMNGVLLAHNTYPTLAGQNHYDLKDANGKLFIKEAVEVAKKGGGWIDFMWTNPDTKKVAPAKGWIQRVPGADLWVMVTIVAQK